MIRESTGAGEDVPDPVSFDATKRNFATRTTRSGLVRILGQGVLTALGIGSGMLFARILTPEDFGIVALVGSFTALLNTVRDFGLPMAMVQRQTLDNEQVNALFWLNLRLSVLILFLTILAGPSLAWFYSEPRLVPITVGVAVAFFGLSLSAQPSSILVRQMRFEALTLIEVGALFTGMMVGIGLGLGGFGYWALVYQLLVTNLCKTLLFWWVCDWRPTWRWVRLFRSDVNLGAFVSYGGHYTGYKLLNYLGKRFDRVLIGYFGGAAAVGLYDNSLRWSYFPLDQLYVPLLSVAVAGLSRIQHDVDAYRKAVIKGVLPILSIVMPVLVLMMVDTQRIILFLMGDQWLDAVPLFRLLCLAALAESVTRITWWIYLSQGETKRQFQWALISTPIMLGTLIVSAQWGVLGLTIGYTSAICLLAYPSLAFCLHRSHLTMGDLRRVLWRPALASIVAAAALLLGQSLWFGESLLIVELLVRASVFGLVYGMAWIAMPGGKSAVQELLAVLHGSVSSITVAKIHRQGEQT